jgi:hypothetical protein
MFALNTDLINKQMDDSTKIYFAVFLCGFGYIIEARTLKNRNDSYYFNTGYTKQLYLGVNEIIRNGPNKIWSYM